VAAKVLERSACVGWTAGDCFQLPLWRCSACATGIDELLGIRTPRLN
jgi:hypothetical protein